MLRKQMRDVVDLERLALCETDADTVSSIVYWTRIKRGLSGEGL